MTEPTREPTTAPDTRQGRSDALRRTLKTYWPNLAIVVVLLGVLVVTYQATDQRRDYVECHTEAMDELHHALYRAMGDTPEDPTVWAPMWTAAFASWQDRIEHCPHAD